ncbi:hypothetical protein FJ657_00650 [Schumannella soli]|uniref:Glycosyltransferase family 29 (Sialyltransferase) n=2 Tax=Schumannella soli TaxID=2590779 RepID=A0A506XYV8_9MICO|nr:hypothetical protein FJ657_00650 [Schumannella soli]
MLRELCAAQARSRPVRSVAVVGNQPLEPSGERAEAIDSCDLVFRVNGFRLDDPDVPCVGTRTDVVVFNRGVRATPWFLSGYRSRLYLMVEPGRLHWETGDIPPWWPGDLGFISMPNAELTIPISAEIGVDATRDPHWPTTGTMAAWTARRLFPEIPTLLAGFSFLDDPDQDSWNHAYGDPSPVGVEHAIRDEGAMMRAWVDDGVARRA